MKRGMRKRNNNFFDFLDFFETEKEK